ncbi:hypothetical protein NLJ89_g7385 [Agrocybe chaxingu]|uniref:Transmembrane protein n=1 Tax=Agrocybe chaxingu TaxID=84603 RepID=A0A9W8MV43_9AGAR|nr:hypothetical protein NLJ89_g7385 [Agrocybe chaxingu]
MSVYEASIDDSDPAVLYSDGWVPVTEDGTWRGTMHSTSIIGSTVRIRFRGSAVAVICTIPTGGEGQRSMATVSLDGGDPVFVSALTTPPVQWNYEFFKADSLPFASHLLVITNAGNEAYLRLDRIDYDPTDGHAPRTQTTTPQAPPAVTTTATSVVVLPGSSTTRNSVGIGQSSTSGEASTLQGNSAADSTTLSGSSGGSLSTESALSLTASSSQQTSLDSINSGNDTSGASQSPESPLAAILGGVLGGLLFLVLTAGLIFFLCRRRRKAAARRAGSGPDLPARETTQRRTVPTPYDLNLGYSTPDSSLQCHFSSYEEGYPQSSTPTRSESGLSSQTALLSPARRNEKEMLAARLSRAGLPSQEAPPAYFAGSTAY